MKSFILDILDEAALDSRIPSGTVNLMDLAHIEVLSEILLDRGLEPAQICEVLNNAIKLEGKHPDRQAYNKEGWLVTFPSKQYRDIAIKKGTHSIADPTHGRGGMNLYYKKKGKQKRQTQQDPTQSEPPAQQGQAPNAPQTPTAQPSEQPPTQPQGNDGETLPKSDGGQQAGQSGGEQPQPSAGKAAGDSSLPPSTPKPSTPGSSTPGSKGGAQQAPTTQINTEPSYPALSVEFAKSKGWLTTQYGEWRDPAGETRAVVGLTGEVVPIKNVDREEYKLFVEKHKA